MVTLITKNREINTNLDEIRKAGDIPAVYYGFKKDSTPISVSMKDFLKVWREAGESSTIELSTEAGTIDALIHEVQINPVKDIPVHVDFLIVDANKEIEVKVPIEFVGESPAVKSGAGTLIKVMHELDVKALPKKLPHAIEVDISSLVEIHGAIHIKDIKLPEGVTAIAHADDVIVSVAEAKEIVEEVSAPVDLSAIEMSVEKGKKEEEVPAEDGKE